MTRVLAKSVDRSGFNGSVYSGVSAGAELPAPESVEVGATDTRVECLGYRHGFNDGRSESKCRRA